MLGNIIGFYDGKLILKLAIDLHKFQNIVDLYVLIKDQNIQYVGEITSIKDDCAFISLMGIIENNKYVSGVIATPSFGSSVSLLSKEQVKSIISVNNYSEREHIFLGESAIYDGVIVGTSINSFFSNHFSVLGSTGSGKSSFIARTLQNLFTKQHSIAYKSSFFLFDAYGEYHNFFKSLIQKGNELNFKAYTTDTLSKDVELIKIPLWLLSLDDYALLLDVQNVSQLPIIEKALKFVSIFSKDENEVMKSKNDVIARAILDLLSSGKSAAQIRDQVLSLLTRFHTSEFNLETPVFQPGYTRSFRQCLLIDANGKIRDIELLITFVEKYLYEEYEMYMPDGSFKYTLDDLKDAFDFALISEGSMQSAKVYDDYNLIRVRLHTLASSKERIFFDCDEYITKTQYIRNLLTAPNGKKAQIINFSINYVDDRLAKNIVKIYSKILFDYSKDTIKRNSLPFHIILEEAHRYIQDDTDKKILQYNIFERIAKEGRKYGVLLGLITQRPSELSETVMSQCSNFITFKMVHPKDIEFIRGMIPNMSTEWITKIKFLSPGMCVAFGSAFNLPIMMKVTMPEPRTENDNCNLSEVWFVDVG